MANFSVLRLWSYRLSCEGGEETGHGTGVQKLTLRRLSWFGYFFSFVQQTILRSVYGKRCSQATSIFRHVRNGNPRL